MATYPQGRIVKGLAQPKKPLRCRLGLHRFIAAPTEEHPTNEYCLACGMLYRETPEEKETHEQAW